DALPDLAGALGRDGRLAIGEQNSVPAGRYARAALSNLGLWPSIQSRTVSATHVRSALAFVASGAAPLGIAYGSAALSAPAVRIVDTFPAGSHPAIVYPIAIVRANDSPAARQLLAVLRSEASRARLLRHGFAPLAGSGRNQTDKHR